MKTSNLFNKMLFAFVTAALVAACGGDGGQKFPRASFSIVPSDVTILAPAQHAKNVCPRAGMETFIKDTSATSREFADAFVLRNLDSPGEFVTIDSDSIIATNYTYNGELGTLLFFKPTEVLANNALYALSFESDGNEENDANRFTTGDEDDCDGESVFEASAVTGMGSAGLAEANFEQFGTPDTDGGINLDFGDLFSDLGGTFAKAAADWVVGGSASTMLIRITFNQPVDFVSAVSGITLKRNNIIGLQQLVPAYTDIDLMNSCTKRPDNTLIDVTYFGPNACIGFENINGAPNYRKVIIYDPYFQAINALNKEVNGQTITEPNLVLLMSQSLTSKNGQRLTIGQFTSASFRTQ